MVVDMEGAAGIGHVKECFPWCPEYHKHGVVQLADDVNAIVRGLRTGGIEDIFVCDWHYMGQNLSESKLEPHAKLLEVGLVEDLKKFLEGGYDGVVLLCFHAMAGTPNGFVSHTMIPFLKVRVNGQPVGEAALIGWLFGTFDIPTVMVTGDEVSVQQAEKFLPGVSVVAVKKAKNREVAQCFPTEEVRQRIEETAMATAQRLGQYQVHRAQEPVLMEVAFRTPNEADLAAAIPKTKRTSPRVVAYESEKYLEAYKFLMVVYDLILYSWFGEAMQKLTATDEGKRIFGEWSHQIIEQWMREPQSLWYE